MFRKNVFILGAGFSAKAGAPVMSDFLEKAKRLRDDPRLELPREDHKTFGNVFKRLAELRIAQAKMDINIENIEHLFGLVDMDLAFDGASSGSTLRRDLILLILRTLEKFIDSEKLDKPRINFQMRDLNGKPYLKILAANYVQLFSAFASRLWIRDGRFNRDVQDAIITMNYDCLLDDCLLKMGVQPDYGLENSELPVEFKRLTRMLPVLKLHGSANWFQCTEPCEGGIWISADSPAKRLEYFYGQRRPSCNHQVEPVIVPPTWAKGGQSTILRPVWTRALQALREAGRIFIIGYSLPRTDEFFKYLLALALATNERLDKIIVVNPSKEAQDTFANLFSSHFGSKLTPVQKEIEEYIHPLGNELGQYEHGFDEDLIRSSRVMVQV